MNEYDNEMDRIAAMDKKSFERLFISLHRLIRKDPLENFIHNPLFMNTELTPGQRVLCKLVMSQPLDGIKKEKFYYEIADSEGGFWLEEDYKTEQEYYKFMTGKEYVYGMEDVFTDITLIVGRRGGKSLVSSILAIYFTLKMNWKPLLGKHKTATIMVMSHTTEFSDEIIDLVRGLIEDSPILSRLVDKSAKNTQSTINLKIPFLNEKTNKIIYSRVRIRTNAASSKSTRGSACPVILADEIAFWGSGEKAKETDFKIVNAASPSQLQFGEHAMFIKLSSPGIKSGLLWAEYENKHKLPKSSLILKAPSWVFNSRYSPAEFRKNWEKCQIDPELNFDAEFRANFVDSYSNFIFAEFVDLCTLKGVTFRTPDEGKDTHYVAAIDAAFKGDRFAFSLVGVKNNRVSQYVLKLWEGNKDQPVKAYQIAEYIANICREFKIQQVNADQFAFQPLREIFEQFGVTLVERTFTNKFKKQIYFNLKKLIHSQEIEFLDSQIQSNEIKQLQVEQKATGTVSISHPPGGKDDTADVIAIAAFLAVESQGTLMIDESEINFGSRYNIAVDIATKRSFVAPSPDMLEDYFKGPVLDNSADYRKNPQTGRYERISEDDDDSPGVV